MAHDVFISYSSLDKPTADAICAKLEERRIRCWIAPRDVLPGMSYAAALVDAIRESRAMVLVFSSRSNSSRHVVNEVERAVAVGIPIVPFRIEDVLPTKDLEYFISRPHWLDALTPPLETHVARLADALQVLFGQAQVVTTGTNTDGDARPVPPPATLSSPTAAPARAATTAFSAYLARFREECAETFSNELVRPDRIYVAQYAATLGDPPEDALLGEVAASLWSGAVPRVAVLGNYGMGKTYFTWRATMDQVSRCEIDAGAAVPILFPLRRFSWSQAADDERPRDLVDQVREHAERLEFPRVDRKQFVRWLEDGAIGVILDGLDELALPKTRTWTEALAPLAGIAGARLLVTSRTAFLSDPRRDLASWRAYEIQPWGDREWRQYLACSADRLAPIGGPDAVAAAVAAKPKLASLTSRPLWCFMIVAIAEEIPAMGDLALTGLYQQFLNRAVKRRPLMDSVMSLAWQYCAMERFADECLRADLSSLDEAQLLTALSQLFESVGHDELKVFLTKQVRTYAFLNCDRHRRYNFGHKSFQEYFAAAGAARWLVEQAAGVVSGPPEVTAREPLLGARRLTDEALGFLAGILREEWLVESLGIVPEGGGKRIQTKLLLFVQKELATDEHSAVLRANLFRLYVDLLRGDTGERPFLSGLCLKGLNLAGADLGDCDFQKADFTDALLTGTRFAGSTFAACLFFGATIDGADFTRADVGGADFVGIDRGDQPPVFTDAVGLDRARVTAREKRFLFG